MNNKGFIFIETIITVVVLITTLVLLYTSYSRVVITEQRRLYYDNISYVYKTQMIRNTLVNSLNMDKFNLAVEEKRNEMYFYIFNIQSDIYLSNSDITKVRELYDFNQLIYVKIEDIPKIKECIKKGNKATDSLCVNTLSFADTYGRGYFEDYLNTLDVDTNLNHDGILISLIYESKNGEVIYDSNDVITIDGGKYSECIFEKVNNHYTSGTADEKMENYNNDSKLNFNMQCENAYYFSWVYL